VWVGVLVAIVLGFGAVAVDFARFYTTANETQLVSDAAALAGAQRLNRLSSVSTDADRLDAVRSSAKYLAGRNRIMSDTAALNDAAVKLVYWNEDAGQVQAAAPSGKRLNAVQVVDTVQTQFVFGAVLFNKFSRIAPKVRRGAVAWTANVSGTRCFKPMGFSISNLYQLMGKPAPTAADTLLTQAQVDSFNALPARQRVFVSYPAIVASGGNANPNNSVPIANAFPYTGLAIGSDGTGGPGGGNTAYQRFLGQDCQGISLDVFDPFNQPSVQWPRETAEVFTGTANGQASTTPGLCRFVSGNLDQTCYTPGTSSIGITFPVAFGIVPSQFGRTGYTTYMVAELTILCFVRGDPANGASGGNPWPGSTCNQTVNNTDPKFTNMSPYSQGTIVGVIQPNLAFKWPQTTYSDVPSITRRLILVK
jgi:hypothetical protein